MNQALLAFYETALLQISLGFVDGVISNEPNPDYTHRMVILPAAPPELIFKGTDPVIAHIRINSFQIKVQEKQNDSEVDRWLDSL